MVARVLIVIAVGALATGCEKRSALYCDRNPDDRANCDQTDAPLPDPVACTMNSQCNGGFCETIANVCVECLENAHCAGEFCDVGGSFTCRGCIADTDCPGGACLPGGSCGSDDTVLYVEPGGINNPTCGAATPCATITYALTLLTTARKYMHLSGEITESPTIKDKNVEIFAAAIGARINGVIGADWVFKIDASIVKIYGLTVFCAGGIDQNGFLLSGAHSTTLDGIDVSGCGRDAGIDVHAGFTYIQHSNIHDNPAGGIKTDGSADYSITNNFIHHNGELTGIFGGVDLGSDQLTDKRFEFNTVVANQVSGMACKNPVVTPNNIVAGNGTILANNAITCDAAGSLVTDNLTPLAFKSTVVPYDYHIGETSTAKDNVTIQSSVADDIDRDLRPQDVAKDFGADEYRAPTP